MTATSRYVHGAARYLHAAPALTAGVLGCLGAQLLTGRLLAHTHDAAHGIAAGVPHVHDRVAASALAGCLVLVSLVAAVAAAGRRGATRAAVMWASGLSIIAFVVIDRVPLGASTATRPSSPLLLAGIAAHVCIGGRGRAAVVALARRRPPAGRVRPARSRVRAAAEPGDASLRAVVATLVGLADRRPRTAVPPRVRQRTAAGATHPAATHQP
ncbi:hypothetical protein OHA72_56950 [Dactylosporangium sp. NBC_01737]|uniref:hypothetical protein n=1 Tax=Dactylosporangium sp. NBC_01737 TaxID=2975959 RepID=UPI002E107425|nr:hypothetical protein OHA72_56950 [Dactylosporangium sp. NBC_01737]